MLRPLATRRWSLFFFLSNYIIFPLVMVSGTNPIWWSTFYRLQLAGSIFDENIASSLFYLQTEDALFIYTVNYVLVLIYKCGSIIIYNEARTFPNVQVLLSNVATTIEFFGNLCVIFLQHFKRISVVLKSDKPPQPNALTVDTWFFFGTKNLLEEASIFRQQIQKSRF